MKILYLAHTGQGYEGFSVIGIFESVPEARTAIKNYRGCNDGFAIVPIEVGKNYAESGYSEFDSIEEISPWD